MEITAKTNVAYVEASSKRLRVVCVRCYADSWFWDIVTYLRSVAIRFYKAPARRLISSGHWKNSVLHQFPHADSLVQNLMDNMFRKTGELTAVRTTSVSQ
jgi:hypothetical protein